MDLRERIGRLMKERKMTARGLSREAGLGERFIADLLDGSKRDIGTEKLKALALALGVSAAELLGGEALQQRILVIGLAGDRETWVPDSKTIDEIDLRLDLGEPVAVAVRGRDMFPVYRDGDLLIGTKRRPDTASEFIGFDCIVETVDGERYVKLIARSVVPGRVNLRSSVNPSEPEIENAKLRWFAPIEVIRRARVGAP